MLRQLALAALLGLSAFCAGALVWRLQGQPFGFYNGAHKAVDNSAAFDFFDADDHPLLLVAGEAITEADLNLERRLFFGAIEPPAHFDGFGEKPLRVAADPTVDLALVHEHVLQSIIERRVLVALIGQDSKFDTARVSQTAPCLEGASLMLDPLDEDVPRLQRRLCELATVESYVANRIVPSIHITDEKVSDFYKANAARFQRPQQVHLRQIVLASENEARRLRARVSAVNFDKLARAFSIAPEASRGGRLDPISKQDAVPRFFEVAFRMRPGDISDVIKSTYGFHILMLERRDPPARLSFEAAAPLIKRRLETLAKERAYREWVELALRTVEIVAPASATASS